MKNIWSNLRSKFLSNTVPRRENLLNLPKIRWTEWKVQIEMPTRPFFFLSSPLLLPSWTKISSPIRLDHVEPGCHSWFQFTVSSSAHPSWHRYHLPPGRYSYPPEISIESCRIFTVAASGKSQSVSVKVKLVTSADHCGVLLATDSRIPTLRLHSRRGRIVRNLLKDWVMRCKELKGTGSHNQD